MGDAKNKLAAVIGEQRELINQNNMMWALFAATLRQTGTVTLDVADVARMDARKDFINITRDGDKVVLKIVHCAVCNDTHRICPVCGHAALVCTCPPEIAADPVPCPACKKETMQ